ncbi:MAG: PspC domain-containing protein [Bacteroidales bacterium]
MHKKLFRSESDKMFGGVCGGIAEYFSIDPTIARLGAVFLTFATGLFPCVIAYVIALIIVPVKPA